MNLIQAVLWDMDGVLIDSERLVQAAFAEVMLSTGLMQDPAERFLDTIGFNRESTLNWYTTFGLSRTEAESLYQQVHEVYLKKAATQLTLKPGVIGALESVEAMGVPQMVVTSTKSAVAIKKLERFNLMPFFQDVLGGDQVTQGKPHPEPYLTGANVLNTATDNVLVIEDSANGVKAGVDAGCMVVHVPDLIATHEDWHHSIYDALDSLESFPAWFASKQMGIWV